jgi:hypothetical protein
MGDIEREKESGFDFEYLQDVPQKKAEIGDTYQTPGFGLAGQLFSSIAKFVIDRLGHEEGERLLKEAVEYFGTERGKRIARRVRDAGGELSFKNWLIYSDIDSGKNFQPSPVIEDGDLVVRVDHCTFHKSAEEWGLGEYAGIYCKYVDYAILGGYNPDITLVVKDKESEGTDHCIFRYSMRGKNK